MREDDARPTGLAARVAHALVRAYQRVTAGRPSPCRYQPTCSSYSLEAFELHGFFGGLWLTARRIGRCHPWGGHGWDPVPEPKSADGRRPGHHHAAHDHAAHDHGDSARSDGSPSTTGTAA